MSYLVIVLALVLLVVLHELGHFLAARAVGIRATKFYVFFPPALFKRTIGDVEYGIGAIPAGGFVKLPGMFEPVPSEVAARLTYDLDPVMPLLRDGDARLRVDAARREIAVQTSPDAIIEPLNEIRASVAAARSDASSDEERSTIDNAGKRVVALLDDVHPRAYWRASLPRRMAVIFAGPLINLIIAFIVLTAFWWFLVPRGEIDGPLRFASVSEQSPAARAGLTEESLVTAWNGPVDGLDAREFGERIADGRGKPVTVTWTNGSGPVMTRTIFPEPVEGSESAIIGVQLAPSVRIAGHERTSIGTGSRIALQEMREVTWGNLSRLPRVFFDREIREDVGSVYGIVQVAEEVDQAGQSVRYVAIISLILAVMNLLPLLPLDGGHLLFGLMEAVRRRPLPRAAFERYSLVGMALVLVLFFIGLDNDIGRASE